MARVRQVLRQGWLLGACAGWAGIVVFYFYRQVTEHWSLGPLGLLIDQYSLHVAVRDILSSGATFWALFTGSLAQRFLAAGEAAQRAGAGLLGALLVILAAFFVGRLLMRLVGYRATGRLEASIFCLATGLGGLAYLLMSLAWLDLYRMYEDPYFTLYRFQVACL